MRVISGIRKGHNLKSPKGKNIRPTEDKIKESLFNIICPIIDDAIVLDLFSGTGQIGIEFLSRGANKAFFVDKSNISISIIKENLLHTKLLDKSIIHNKDARVALKLFTEENLEFDYIYIDPPYKEYELVTQTLEIIVCNNLLKSTGLIIIEHDNDLILDDRIKTLIKIDIRKYKNKSLTFYRIGDKIWMLYTQEVLTL